MPALTRRRVFSLTASVAAAAACSHARFAGAEDEIESHGLSAFGDLAYPADFHHLS
jgi:microcin C transport system substrate-binding protein